MIRIFAGFEELSYLINRLILPFYNMGRAVINLWMLGLNEDHTYS
ncbi:hypothetical protein PMIT1323_00507 [Prochlorococcus marinus str. MIT 1323]|nr:hypothetical protein PMIT1323_00507 [Prochlorococcus marinus str. MIT 1323]